MNLIFSCVVIENSEILEYKKSRKRERMLQGMLVDDSMSNLTSASNEASISSSNRTEIPTTIYPQQSFAISPDNPTQPPPKKKRNLPGNPDPEAEVVALSPKSLLATNRFICEICNKGFQRDQNLQLHRRGHNLPWKLKQRNNKEVVKKKVYVCPEPSCVHHDPSRALGDLTGIKKHFSRKHGEKKWKCEKCSKRYAVQSDWKAHSKICGTREYRCDCGTLFSRRDSFITHRAFCDALAEESARSMTQMNPLLSSQQGTSSTPHPPHLHGIQPFSLKQEQQMFSSRTEVPPWMTVESGLGAPGTPRSELFTSSSRLEQSILHQENTNPKNPTFSSALNPSHHMSATALLQKAAQIGVKMSSSNSKTCTAQSDGIFRAHMAHMGAPGFSATSLDSSTAGARLGLSSSREEIATGFVNVTSGCMEQLVGATVGASSSMLHDMNMLTSLPPNSGFEGSSAFEDTFNRMLNSKRDNNFQENLPNPGTSHLNIVSKEATASGGSGAGGRGGGGNDGMTRDFLGLRAFPHRDFLNMAGFDQMDSSSYDQQTHQHQSPWQN